MNQPTTPPTTRFQRLLQRLKPLSPKHLVERETWSRFGRWLAWSLLPKRRRIRYLTRLLIPLDSDVPPDVQTVRDEVFMLTCLKLKKLEERRRLLEVLNSVNNPFGFEQIFLCSIYPSILNRNLVLTPLETKAEHRLDVEIGYLGHNEDYFFWVFEIDGRKKTSMDATLAPQQRRRDDKLYPAYQLHVIELFDGAELDAMEWIINSQVYFTRILADLRKRNYKVTAASIPQFEWGRLSLLRRLSLNALKRRQSRSERRNR